MLLAERQLYPVEILNRNVHLGSSVGGKPDECGAGLPPWNSSSLHPTTLDRARNTVEIIAKETAVACLREVHGVVRAVPVQAVGHRKSGEHDFYSAIGIYAIKPTVRLASFDVDGTYAEPPPGITGGEAIVDILERAGVGPMFGMGGFQLLPFYEGWAKEGAEASSDQ